MNKKELPWLRKFSEDWEARIAQGRTPHAILLRGPAGVGKRSAAVWLARRHLGVPGKVLPEFPVEIPELADLSWVQPAEDKQAIGIDAVRTLVAHLSLTSHAGRGKVAIIEPADAMTGSAANSLLKTLEEPAGNALLILVVDRAGRLPATIVSRCQRIDIALPPAHQSLGWLNDVRRSDYWGIALRQASNAPLRALLEAERLEEAVSLSRDLLALANREALPLDVAARWQRLDPGFVLEWLSREIQDAIRCISGEAQQAGASLPDSVLQRMDRRKLFCYLDTINRIRSQLAGSYNVQLTLESLLIDWADGLREYRSAHESGTMRLTFAR